IPITCFEDIVMQRVSCINCSDNDVIVLISHTGRPKSKVEIANLARENGATVIAITAKDSPLEKASSLAITLDIPEDTDLYMPMASRVVQMTVIDVLATGFTLPLSTGFRKNLKRVKDALKDSRYDKLN
ncbi:SIS domain-containing protein, partial [Vibrio parahaemolyticus]|uniref:SIS domain-containing protein n=1 Tax=Vibrio parahaemolyticus TaxID=670 RepID=UPI00062B0D21